MPCSEDMRRLDRMVEVGDLHLTGQNGYVVICRDCGVVQITSSNRGLPYEYQCPSCGRQGKIHKRKKWDEGKHVFQIMMASTRSEAGQHFLSHPEPLRTVHPPIFVKPMPKRPERA